MIVAAAPVRIASQSTAGGLEPPKACILIASRNGEQTIARTIKQCAHQADVYCVSDGSTDDTVLVAERAGAITLELTENVGKPNALRAAYAGFGLGILYDAILILDDDTRLAPDFIERAMEAMHDDVVVVCGETRSDWLPEQRWNGLIGARALAYWRYGLFLKQGQHLLNAITVIPGSNSVFRTDVMTVLLEREVRYIVDDTQWLLDIQTEKLGRVSYARSARAYVQDPATLGEWYKQTLRWLHGSMQGIRGHRIGRTWSWFSVAYSALIFDWILYVAVWPVALAFVMWRAWSVGSLGLALSIYVGGYIVWAAIGAIAVKNWRLPLMFPTLMFMDWVQRVVFVHAFFRTFRVPVSECKWDSPARQDTRKEVLT
jgi:biofilm PGA synthesis N-glycosyltransferase PgaC